MQGQETQNVISLFAARNKSEGANAASATSQAAAEETTAADTDKVNPEDFEEVMRRNQANKDRLAKERSSANKSVLRSYRIKN
jgi:hypothetical protein